MVFTLHRYIFRDLLKTFCLSALVLSVILGLGVMLRPLRHFNVDPIRVPQLLLYTFPITLTMVIPIAALLAATLNYGRLAYDNEINACRSSGISLLTLLYPALVLALLVGMAAILLGFHIIPSFTEDFETLIRSDAKAIVFRNIEQKGNLGDLLPDYRVYADYADPKKNLLSGVAVLKLRHNEVEEITTARQVQINFQRQNPQSDQIALRLINARTVINNYSADIGDTTIYIPVPSLWQDEIKFKKLAQMKAIERDMTLFPPINKSLTDIRRQFMAESFFQGCDQQFRRQGFVDLHQSAGGYLRLFAAGCRRYLEKTSAADAGRKTSSAVLTGAAQVLQFNRSEQLKPNKTYRTDDARLSVRFQAATPVLILEMKNVRAAYANEENVTNHRRYDLYDIVFPKNFITQGQALSLNDQVLRDLVPLPYDPPTPYLLSLYKTIQKQCRELSAEIRAELHTRLAFGVSCIVLVLTGAALGIIFRSGHLLTAFGVSFIPATFCLITIFTGKHIAEQNPGDITGGIVFLWSGIVTVAALNLVIYKLLLKR